jgi:hypothetical protein
MAAKSTTAHSRRVLLLALSSGFPMLAIKIYPTNIRCQIRAATRGEILDENKAQAFTKPQSPKTKSKGSPYKAIPISTRDSRNWLMAIGEIISLSRIKIRYGSVIEGVSIVKVFCHLNFGDNVQSSRVTVRFMKVVDQTSH